MSIEVTFSWWEREAGKPDAKWEARLVRRKVRARNTRAAQSREINLRFAALLRRRLKAGMESESLAAFYPAW